MTLAQKMMEKMGWKEGSGLGKDGQGMTTPLMAQKDGIRSGIIVNAPEMFPNRSTIIGEVSAEGDGAHTLLGAPAFVSSGSSLAGSAVVPAVDEGDKPATPTRVLLLRNLTGPGEVDGDLEDEVAEECERFGAVVRVQWARVPRRVREALGKDLGGEFSTECEPRARCPHCLRDDAERKRGEDRVVDGRAREIQARDAVGEGLILFPPGIGWCGSLPV